MNKYSLSSELNQKFSFPSPVVQMNVKRGAFTTVINIPEKEVGRLSAILIDREYSLMDPVDISRPMTIIDVGANVGLFAVYDAKILNEHNIIHCFEPSHATFSLLSLNVENFDDIHLYRVGLGKIDDEVYMNIHPCNTGENSVKFKFENLEDKRVFNEVEKVQLVNAASEFDKLGLKHIDVLKIDTEGCEVDILESLDYRVNMIDYVLLEYHSEADRRRIDNVLNRFHLYGSSASGLGQGIVKYISNRLV